MKNKIMVVYTIAISSILLVSVASVFAQIPSLEPKPDSNTSSSSPSPPPGPIPNEDNKLVLGPVTIPIDEDTKLDLNTADSKISIDPKK